MAVRFILIFYITWLHCLTVPYNNILYLYVNHLSSFTVNEEHISISYHGNTYNLIMDCFTLCINYDLICMYINSL